MIGEMNANHQAAFEPTASLDEVPTRPQEHSGLIPYAVESERTSRRDGEGATTGEHSRVNMALIDQNSDEEELKDVLSPGRLYPAESGYDAAEYTENRTQFAPRQMSASPHMNQEHQYQQHREPSMQQESANQPNARFLAATKTQQPNQASTGNLSLHSQGSQSSLMKQFSEKIKAQAERLQRLETYKRLCERRILDFDPQHALPVTENMLGQASEATRETAPNSGNLDYKRQLAIKEQDLVYARQRAEKTQKENEYLRAEVESLKQSSPKQTEEKSLMDQVQQLQEEKNALLDYIEESVNVTQDASALKQNGSLSKESRETATFSVQELQTRVSQLEDQNEHLQSLNNDLKTQVDQFKSRGQNPLKKILSAQLSTYSNQETFGNLPTGVTARSPMNNNDPQLATRDSSDQQALSNSTLPQVQSIDYMVLDLNNVKQELMETQNQFSSTQKMLADERQQKSDIQQRLEEAQARIIDYEQQLQAVPNPWQNTMQSQEQAHQEVASAEHDFQYKVKLVEERDRLLDKNSKLHDAICGHVKEIGILKTTLDETQGELEQLVNDHENVSRQVNDLQGQLREAQDLPRRLRLEAQGIRDKLEEKTNEVFNLQGEMRGLSRQAEMDMDTLKQLRAENLRLEGQMVEMKDSGDNKVRTQSKQWESTLEDLTKDLRAAQATIVEKDTVFQKVERELRNKLHEVEDATSQKSGLLRRIEDLNHEVRQLQAVAERKDSQLKEQSRQIEELTFELERQQMQVQKVSHEKDHAQELRKEDCNVLEMTQHKVEKQSKVINKVCRDINKVQELVNSISREFNLPTRVQPESAVPTKDRRASSSVLDEQLREANGFLKQIGDWLVAFAKTYKQALKTIEMGSTESDGLTQQIKRLEARCHATQQEQFEAQEKGRNLADQLVTLKAEFMETQTLQKDGYDREERIHKKNQQLKTQLEAVKIQKEKLSIQIKTLLGEKEQLKESVEQRSGEVDEVSERSKMYELQISQLIEQKQSFLDLFTRFKDAFPSESLRSVFSQIIEVVKEGHTLDSQFVETEDKLLAKEGALRKYAKREVEGLLSTKVINIRKEVEQGRSHLREMHHTRDDLAARLTDLEAELKQNETIERRRTDVALETEHQLAQTRQEMQDLRKETIFITNNRNDLEIALKASQQEREMLQRELLTLRNQLKLKADLHPEAYKSAQHSGRKITSYNATQSSLETNLPGRTFSGDRMAYQPSHSTSLRNGESAQKYPHQSNERHPIEDPMSVQESQALRPEPVDLPVKRRFPSQEPAYYGALENRHASHPVNTQNLNYQHATYHQPAHSDLPLQMPNLTDRKGERMRPSIYGGVMSGPGAQTTTAAFSLIDQKPPSSARAPAQHSSRPPTYQSTQSNSKRSNPNLAPQTTSFNPLPASNEYQTGNFAQEPIIANIGTKAETSVYTLRNTLHHSHKSSSMTNLHHIAPGISHVTSGEPLQPIVSSHGGELTSRSGRQSPAAQDRYNALLNGDRRRESPLRSSRKVAPGTSAQLRHSSQTQNNGGGHLDSLEDSKLDANAYAAMNHQSTTQKSVSGYGGGVGAGHKSSINESSIHNKLSALQNLFGQIRQNLDESSMTGTRTAGHHSSIDQSLIQNQDYC